MRKRLMKRLCGHECRRSHLPGGVGLPSGFAAYETLVFSTGFGRVSEISCLHACARAGGSLQRGRGREKITEQFEHSCRRRHGRRHGS